MKRLLIGIFIFQLVLFVGCKAKELTPEQQAKAEQYTQMIESHDFKFEPINAQPTGGRNINLTADYFLKITNDTIEAYLPYFGRAYSAPFNSSDSGIKFLSTDFTYSSQKKKNGTYDIQIEPKDLTNNMLLGLVMNLSVSNSGYGTLSVRSNQRQSISFYGTIE